MCENLRTFAGAKVFTHLNAYEKQNLSIPSSFIIAGYNGEFEQVGEKVYYKYREAATTNPNCTRIYIKDNDAYTRTTPLSANENAIRLRFTAVSRAVAQRKQDLSQITSDQAAFEAQKNQPGGKKTMLAYLWSLEGATYDAAHPRS